MSYVIGHSTYLPLERRVLEIGGVVTTIDLAEGRPVARRWLAIWVSLVLAVVGSIVTAVPAQAAMSVDAFIGKYNNTAVHADGVFGAQCVDLFNKYHQEVLGGSYVTMAISGGAKDLWSTNNSAEVNRLYTRVAAGQAPRKGDVAVWGGSAVNDWYGHVAIVTQDAAAGAGTIQVFSRTTSRPMTVE